MAAKKKKLNLYVWENVMQDYSPGMAVALAESPEQAIDLIAKKAEELEGLGDYVRRHLIVAPLIVENPEGFYVTGGG